MADWCRWVDKPDAATAAIRQRERLDADIADFLARGGEIQCIPAGVGKRETGKKLTRAEIAARGRNYRFTQKGWEGVN